MSDKDLLLHIVTILETKKIADSDRYWLQIYDKETIDALTNKINKEIDGGANS